MQPKTTERTQAERLRSPKTQTHNIRVLYSKQNHAMCTAKTSAGVCEQTRQDAHKERIYTFPGCLQKSRASECCSHAIELTEPGICSTLVAIRATVPYSERKRARVRLDALCPVGLWTSAGMHCCVSSSILPLLVG